MTEKGKTRSTAFDAKNFRGAVTLQVTGEKNLRRGILETVAINDRQIARNAVFQVGRAFRPVQRFVLSASVNGKVLVLATGTCDAKNWTVILASKKSLTVERNQTRTSTASKKNLPLSERTCDWGPDLLECVTKTAKELSLADGATAARASKLAEKDAIIASLQAQIAALTAKKDG